MNQSIAKNQSFVKKYIFSMRKGPAGSFLLERGEPIMTEEQGIQIVKLRGQGLGYKQIAGMVNLSRDSVRSYCKTRGLTGYVSAVRMNMKDMMDRGAACGFCGGPMKKAATGRPRRFCCEECRRRYWKGHRAEIKKSESAIYIRECLYCHETFESYGNKNRKFCCHDHYIKYRFYEDGKKGGNEDGVQEN